MRKEITLEEIGKFMEGRDPEERIVNLLYNYQDDFITIVYRNENDQKCTRQESFYPFVWATRYACNRLCEGNREVLKQLMKEFGIGVKKLSNTDNKGNVVECFENGYMFMFYALKPMSYTQFLNFFKRAKYPVYRKDTDKNGTKIPLSKADEGQYLTVTPQEQFMISTGKRFFKGYNDYDDLLRMIFDLETEGLDPTRHRIKLNGIKLNRPVTVRGKTYQNFERIFDITGKTKAEKDASELKIIDTMLRIIYTFRPDVITAHNGENFDWNFIIERCRQLGTTMEEMSKPYFNNDFIRKEERESILKLGGEVESFRRTIVPNTIITDSLHAVRRAQATDSNFLKATLKYSTDYLGLKKDNRVYTPGEEIDKILTDETNKYAFNNTDGDWYIYDETSPNGANIPFRKGKDGDKTFVPYTRNYLAEGYEIVSGRYIIERYLYDDLWECDRVEYTLNTTNFFICKILPVQFAKCCTMGTAGQWKAIMLAWSYENDLAIPKAENTGAFTGGLSRLLNVGFVDNVIKLDYNSLYPSIILTWGISDDTDLMNAMLKMLEYVLTQREKYKGEKKKAGKIVDMFEDDFIAAGIALTIEQSMQYNKEKLTYSFADKKQNQQKVLANSFFGSYGSNNGSVFPWKSQKCAEQTTCTGRQCLRLMISHFHKLGYKPIVGDTDGFNFKLPQSYRYTEDNPYIGLGLSRETKVGKEYVGFEADVAEFNDIYMKDFHYNDNAVNKMGLGIDEVVSSTINFSRKNYADYFPTKPFPKDVKLVGNTIKSKKMPEYISKFLAVAIRQLLKGDGQGFLNEYYSYIDKIYNYRIPLRDIATKGKIKKSINQYLNDVKQLTKAGRPKSRQAWYELAIEHNLMVNNGDTIYYINTGTSKSHSDIKKVTHYYIINENNEKVEITKDIDKNYKIYKKETVNKPLSKTDWISVTYPKYFIEEEIIKNCVLVPTNIINKEEDTYCDDDNKIEYNVAKYIDMFNKRIKPLLVCFDRSIREKILITNPNERQFFTESESQMSSGQPNKLSDQDTYEQLMTMEDKEIKFWTKYNLIPPFIEECGMGKWEDIVADYKSRVQEEERLGVDKEKELYQTILRELTEEEISAFEEDGDIPSEILKIVDIDPKTGNFVSKNYKEIVIGSMYDILEARQDYELTQINDSE